MSSVLLLLELTTGQTAGIVIGAALFIIGIIVAYLFYRSYKSRKGDDKKGSYNLEAQTVSTYHDAPK